MVKIFTAHRTHFYVGTSDMITYLCALILRGLLRDQWNIRKVRNRKDFLYPADAVRYDKAAFAIFWSLICIRVRLGDEDEDETRKAKGLKQRSAAIFT